MYGWMYGFSEQLVGVLVASRGGGGGINDGIGLGAPFVPVTDAIAATMGDSFTTASPGMIDPATHTLSVLVATPGTSNPYGYVSDGVVPQNVIQQLGINVQPCGMSCNVPDACLGTPGTGLIADPASCNSQTNNLGYINAPILGLPCVPPGQMCKSGTLTQAQTLAVLSGLGNPIRPPFRLPERLWLRLRVFLRNSG